MQRRATAIALVLVVAGIAAGLAGAPVTAQHGDDQGEDNDAQGQAASSSSSSSDCPSPADFEVKKNEGNAQSRDLDGGEEIIGIANITTDSPRDLMVELETSNDELAVEVFHEVVSGGEVDCREFNQSDCDQDVTSTTEVTICRLDAPEDKSYWVHYTNNQTLDLELTFHTWAPVV